MKGILYIVATPIGNLEDITLRALRILKTADIIAAEDTRHSLKLLNHYGISKPMISYWKEKEKVRSDQIIEKLKTGQSVALITDAGTPGISDPGAVIIRKAIEEDVQIVIIPGPSAFVAALSLSGLPTDEFVFIGFLPSKKGQRQKFLKDLSLEAKTLIFYEAPHRIIATLMDMEEIFEERKAVIVKEITKIHEEVLRGSLSEILKRLEKSKISGEYVIILQGKRNGKRIINEDIISEVRSLLKKGFSRKEAVKKIADEYGISKKELYDKSLNHTT
ncbi:MAG: 16S rRNA (cytidine(1402)-2'-O)-methyltransferase [Nitrospirae bacterium]|nr:16S rRNA (cytidine(1402)-2'-O)-methyltransferase [Nitrospirota bacterium]